MSGWAGGWMVGWTVGCVDGVPPQRSAPLRARVPFPCQPNHPPPVKNIPELTKRVPFPIPLPPPLSPLSPHLPTHSFCLIQKQNMYNFLTSPLLEMSGGSSKMVGARRTGAVCLHAQGREVGGHIDILLFNCTCDPQPFLLESYVGFFGQVAS